MLDVSREGYDRYKKNLCKPYKHASLLAKIQAIISEDEFNDKYGRKRLCEALSQQGVEVSERTIYRICKQNNILVHKKRPKGLTKADKNAVKEQDLLVGNFEADEPGQKLICDITQLPTADGKLYIAIVVDCYDNSILGLAMDDNMRDELTQNSLKSAYQSHSIQGAILHSDCGSQYTSFEFKKLAKHLEIKQSMSLARLSCYGNAKCESIFARFKSEAIYGRYNTKTMSMEAVKRLVFRYLMGYWNNRRICSANGGLPPFAKRKLFFQSRKSAA